MALDTRIEAAINEAVLEVGQSREVADKLVAWVSDLTTGNTKLTDKDSVRRHLQLLFNTVHVAEPAATQNTPEQEHIGS